MAVLTVGGAAVAGGHLGPGADGCPVQAEGDFREAGFGCTNTSDYFGRPFDISADGCCLLCDSCADRLTDCAVLPATVLAQGWILAGRVYTDAHYCSSAMRPGCTVALSAGGQDESGKGAEE